MPENHFTYEEIGAFLIAIGIVVSESDVCAGAANDGQSDERLRELLLKHGVDEERVQAVLAMPLDFAINYIAPIRGVDYN